MLRGFGFAALAVFILSGTGLSVSAADKITGLEVSAPQPAVDQLQPGLAVTYYFNKF